MSVSITTIQGTDALSMSRLTINSNFSNLKAGIDSLQLLLDPTTLKLSGIKSITVDDNAVPSSTSILRITKGSSLLGNVIMGTTGASTSVLINGNGGISIPQSTLTISNGSLNVTNGLAAFGGHISVSKESRMPGVANAFASMTSLTQQQTLTINDLKYVVLTNGITASSTGVTAQLPAGSTGQVLEIFHIKGPSGNPVLIKPVANDFYGITGPIQMTQTGDTIRVIYDGANWYLWNYNPSSLATSVGSTGSSITFTLS